MPNSKQIVYLSQAQYAELIVNGTITVNGVTVTYDENDIYVTPQAEPVTDVRVAGTSVSSDGVANVPIASGNSLGLVKTSASGSDGLIIGTNGNININRAYEFQIKAGTDLYRPIVPECVDRATFFGLAKVAGADMKNIANTTVGTYPDEQKSAIQQMLGVSDLIATAENSLVASKAYAVGDIFTANGKLYKATAAIAADEAIVLQNEGETISGANAIETSVSEGFPHDVQVNGVSVVTNGVANVSVPTNAASVGAITAPSSPATGAFLVYNGSAWVAQTLSTWQGGNY